MGKRTKFQCSDLAQLILKVTLNNDTSLEELEVETCTLPKDLKLDDEVRLDKIKFIDNSLNTYPTLTGLQQAVILSNL